MEFKARDRAERKLWKRKLFLRREIHDVQGLRAAFVDGEGDLRTVVRKIEVRDVPLDSRGENVPLLRGDVDRDEAMKLRVLVGPEDDFPSVLREGGPRVGDLLFGL